MQETNNRVKLVGTILSKPEYDHEVFGEGFYTFTLQLLRTSGTADNIPIMVSERLIDLTKIHIGERISIEGKFRSYNQHLISGNHLKLNVFATDISFTDIPVNDKNEIFLEGYVCKPTIYRATPLGRKITDMLIAVNRSYGKSDYIPNICWGRNAIFASKFSVGDNIIIEGRIQSRIYKKNIEGNPVEKTAYEVSIEKVKLKE